MQLTFKSIYLAAIIGAAVGCANHAAADYEVFVSPQGNDAWSGGLAEPDSAKSDGPVATLQRARDLVRAFKRKVSKEASEPIYITLRGGTYRLSEPLQLGQ